jgi:cyclohexanecarboxyl-CoA dehydrogenase
VSAVLSFAFTDEQQAFADTLRQFAVDVLAPGYRDRAASTAFPWDVYRQLGDLGLLGIGLPERYGGTGVDDPIVLGLAAETLAYGDVNVAFAPVFSGLVAHQLAEGATDDLAQRYLPSLIAGEKLVAVALTEPGAGSDAAGLSTTATPASGGFRLSGEKTAITAAVHAEAALIYAREPGSSRGHGISCFLVPLDAPGVNTSPTAAMGCAPLGWGSIHLDDVHIPADHLIGEPGRGLHGVLGHFDFSRPALGLMCLGAARASLDEAGRYALERIAFGKPLAAHQGISLALAEQETYLEAARWLCYRALWLRATGRPHTAEAAMGKWWPPIVAKDAIEQAMRTFGNLGYSSELPLQQRYRDVMAYLIADGTAEIQKRVIATTRLGRIAAG